jgi:oxygen-independent coproporphyrinogen-3 oxidase
MKLGRVETAYFARKFGVDLLQRFRSTLEAQRAAGWLEFTPERITTTRAGLLRVDSLLPDYFLEPHRNARYA